MKLTSIKTKINKKIIEFMKEQMNFFHFLNN